MADSIEEIKKSQNKYLLILGILCVFTLLTVAVATLPILDFGEHGFDKMDAIIGLIIASIKATLVGAIFMHLNHEKKLIYWVFGGSFIFAFFLMWLTGWAFTDPIRYGKGTGSSEKMYNGFYNPEVLPSEAAKKKD